MGVKESSHSSVPILLSIGLGQFTEPGDAEAFPVDSVTQSKFRRKHRERLERRRGGFVSPWHPSLKKTRQDENRHSPDTTELPAW
jgi:hypothetical protein